MTFTTAAFDRSSSWRFKPSPTGRLRRVLLHLSYSMALSHLLDTTPPSLLTIAACRGLRPRLTAGLEGPALISRTAPHLLLQKRVRDTPSRCHLSPRRGARRRIRLANSRPNLRAHCRTVSWLTMMPRPASNSSTMRRPSGKRKYSHTAWLITSAGTDIRCSGREQVLSSHPTTSPPRLDASAVAPPKLTVPSRVTLCLCAAMI